MTAVKVVVGVVVGLFVFACFVGAVLRGSGADTPDIDDEPLPLFPPLHVVDDNPPDPAAIARARRLHPTAISDEITAAGARVFDLFDPKKDHAS